MKYQPQYPGLCEHIARTAHANQFRRDGATPYINHPAAVVAGLPEFRDHNHKQLLRDIAWLHDVLKDCPHVTANLLIAAGVSDQVISRVILLTKSPGQDYTEYLIGVGSDFYAATVKIADIRSNLADNPTEKSKAKYADALPYLTARVLQHAEEMLREHHRHN